ncbi:MAG TPA: hypothetical protein VHM88_24515 [Candidatus Acidoferrales bacterium]|jgi:hypothetical protein|nr:hypothetical protein [Candidatus Acidoferrales bacterium]
MEIGGATEKPSYFLVSVSTRENLELCIKHGLAGFPSGESGAWTFCEIEKGDFVSFLYGARGHNLYKVADREAIRNAEIMPPWRLLTFKESGKTYSFPFRLHLKPIRVFIEPLVRAEFSYVAENLLLRGGYRKTHFQADQTTLQGVSEMGTSADGSVVALPLPQYKTFTPRFTRSRKLVQTPETCRFQETILQSAIRRHLMCEENLQTLLAQLNLAGAQASALEILGEKALTQGHIDLLLKQRIPLGSALKIPIEVKMSWAQPDDLSQLRGYMDELGECPIGILVAADFSKHSPALGFCWTPNCDENE